MAETKAAAVEQAERELFGRQREKRSEVTTTIATFQCANTSEEKERGRNKARQLGRREGTIAYVCFSNREPGRVFVGLQPWIDAIHLIEQPLTKAKGCLKCEIIIFAMQCLKDTLQPTTLERNATSRKVWWIPHLKICVRSMCAV